MGTANRDASLLTKNKRNMAENAYYNAWAAATKAGLSSVTPPARGSAELLTEIKLGCTACYVLTANDPEHPRYPNNFSSGRNTGTS